jgi:hypothetical protein
MSVQGMKENFEGRIRNVSLSPSTPGNALVPIFEAVSNSLSAIEARFKERAKDEGRVDISLERGGDVPTFHFQIQDNGIGLNHDNFDAFQTLDTNYKVRGKGVGCLTWLKVFDTCRVSSVYEEGASRRRRSFVFAPSNQEPFRDYQEIASDGSNGTTIELRDMKADYAASCPAKAETIAKRIIAHFTSFRSFSRTSYLPFALPWMKLISLLQNCCRKKYIDGQIRL